MSRGRKNKKKATKVKEAKNIPDTFFGIYPSTYDLWCANTLDNQPNLLIEPIDWIKFTNYFKKLYGPGGVAEILKVGSERKESPVPALEDWL